eukprot:scaffold283817_cov17-Tisochrysis_lutea.AAC.1
MMAARQRAYEQQRQKAEEEEAARRLLAEEVCVFVYVYARARAGCSIGFVGTRSPCSSNPCCFPVLAFSVGQDGCHWPQVSPMSSLILQPLPRLVVLFYS